ncbi:MAG: NHL repeat-containing protein [candidate division Zixibacteria bacterium]|nr:NHL repeat-containing protein [candidate division Zixibacteria bacterium]
MIPALVLLLLSCGPRPGQETRPVATPLGLILETVIEGTVLSRSLSQPKGVTVDNTGAVYVVDAGNNRIIRFSRDMQALRDVGGFGTAEGLLKWPTYITADRNLNLYVSEEGNQRISVFDTHLNFGYLIDLVDPEDPLKYGRPAGIAISEFGEVLVADRDNSRIAVFNSFSNFDRFVGGAETSAGYLLKPTGIYLLPDNTILTCDNGNAKIEKFDAFGIYMSSFGGGYLNDPSGITVDDHGNIWVVDRDPAALCCFDGQGNALYIGERGRDAAFDKMEEPFDVAALPGSRLIVSDVKGDRLLVYHILYQD